MVERQRRKRKKDEGEQGGKEEEEHDQQEESTHPPAETPLPSLHTPGDATKRRRETRTSEGGVVITQVEDEKGDAPAEEGDTR